MYRALLISSTIFASVVLVTCGVGTDESGNTEPSQVFLSFGTAPPGGAFFVVGSALAEVVNETGTAEGFSVTAEATSGSQENIRRLVTGELDFALSNAAITYFASRGTEGWDRAYPHPTLPSSSLSRTPVSNRSMTLEGNASRSGRPVRVSSTLSDHSSRPTVSATTTSAR